MALRFIDTPEFQRLASLRQLGAAFMVFSSAEHTRKSHSLGVYHVARWMARSLQTRHGIDRVSDRTVELVGIAGLLHDLGHFAFSHVGDAFLAGVDSPRKTHEARSVMLVRHMVAKYNIPLTADEVDAVCAMIHPGPEHQQWMYRVVSGTVDADRCDYIVRDSSSVGILSGFSRHHVEHIVSHLRIGADGQLELDRKAERSAAQLLEARRALHRAVYQHRVCVAIEAMIADVMTLIEPTFRFQERLDDPEQFVTIDDGLLTAAYYDDRTPPAAKDLLRRLWTRDLYTTRHRVCYDDVDGFCPTLADVPDHQPDDVVVGRWIGLDNGSEHPLDNVRFHPPAAPVQRPPHRQWCVVVIDRRSKAN